MVETETFRQNSVTVGIQLASWASGKIVSTSVPFVLKRNGSTVPEDQYTLDRENGRVDKKTYDSTGAAVPWAFTDTYTATYALYDTATYTTSSTYTDQAQTYGEFDTAPAPFDPESGRVNATALTGLIVTATQFADVLTSDGYNGSAKGWSIARGGDLVGIDVALKLVGTTGYIALGTTPPTSATNGTGIWIDRTIIVGLNANTQQFYLRASDGKAVAGAGAVTLDVDGISITQGATNANALKWYQSGTKLAEVRAKGTNTELSVNSLGGSGATSTSVDLQAGVTNTVSLNMYGDGASSRVVIRGLSGTFAGLGIGPTGTPSALVHLKSTAPTFLMEDSTGSAKSLLVTVDANNATFGEWTGGTFFTLDLANKQTKLDGHLIFTDNTYDIGASGATRARDLYLARDLYTANASFMHRSKATLNNGSGAGAGTLTNAPAAGDPTKWIPIDDNGITRYIPAW